VREVKKRFLSIHVVSIKDGKDIIMSGEEATREIIPEIWHLKKSKREGSRKEVIGN